MLGSRPFTSTELTFVSPAPRPYRSVLTLLQPMTPKSWAAVAAALVLAAAALQAVSSREERTVPGVDLREWATASRAAWYAFGALVGESVTRDTTSAGAWAVRCGRRSISVSFMLVNPKLKMEHSLCRG